MYQHLRDFIQKLKEEGELTVITKTVSPYLEISGYTDRESKSPGGGKALFFQNVEGSPFPAATNLFGSEKRITRALGVQKPDDLASRIREYLQFDPPKNLKQALHGLPLILGAAGALPRKTRRCPAPCQEVVHKGKDVDLSILPALHCWPKDAGRFITLPIVITKSLKTGKRNAGMYRLQIYDKNTTGMHWHIHKDGSHYFQEYKAAKKRMPVAVGIGGDPAITYAATAPMPMGMDEMILAGFIRKKGVPMVKCLTVDLEVPAYSDFVLEGYVEPDELRREGPFGDHTGYYSLADDYPVFHVTAITHKTKPIYNATLVGPPPMEDCYLAKATERLFLPMLQMVFPEIQDYWFPWEGVFHNIVIVSIDKLYPGHAHKIMNGLWGQGQMSFCKAIVVVDKDVDPKSPDQVMAVLLNRFDIETDVVSTKGVLDVLDHSSPHPNFGNKIGLDLTRRVDSEPNRNVAKNEANGSEPDIETILSSLPEIKSLKPMESMMQMSCAIKAAALTVKNSVKKCESGKKIAENLLHSVVLRRYSILVMYDEAIDLDNHSLLLWKLFNNTDPGRDIHELNGRIIIDACIKGKLDGHDREWPDELVLPKLSDLNFT